MDPTPHIQPDVLASFVDGELDEASRERIRRHLGQCSHCHATYEDALRYLGVWHTDPTKAPSDLVAAGNAIAAPPRRRTAFPRWPWAVAAVSAAAVVTLVVMWQPWVGVQDPAEQLALLGDAARELTSIEPIRLAARNASERGALVIPGVEHDLRVDAPAYRSGGDVDVPVRQAIESLSRRFNDGHADAEETYWLVSAYVATGQQRTARRYLPAARVRFADDTRFVVLEAMLAYHDSDLGDAESFMRAALVAAPDDPVVIYNLAVIVGEQADGAGRSSEVADLVDQLRDRAPGSPLSQRAERLISQFD